MRGIVWLMVLLIAGGVASAAQAQMLQDSFGAWRVFMAEKGGNMTCYIASVPTKQEGNFTARSEPYLLVTHKSPTQDEVSVSSGYRYQNNSELELRFGQRVHKLFVKEELAWAYDAAADKVLVKEMIRGANMVAKGTSWKGTHSVDTYSLNGFTAAHRRMKQLCK